MRAASSWLTQWLTGVNLYQQTLMNLKYRLKGETHFWSSREEIVEAYDGVDMTDRIEEVDIDSEDYILRDIPKEMRSPMAMMAWDNGHSAGEDEVRLYLREYVEKFREPLIQLEERIRAECS